MIGMCVLLSFFILCLWLHLSTGNRMLVEENSRAAHLHEPQEYCINTEAFEARCLKSEVVVMTRALYGRMKIGRCLKDEDDEILAAVGSNPRFLGCSVDVLSILDRRCSGRAQCEVRLHLEPALQREQPCHASLKNYLEASYNCVTDDDPDLKAEQPCQEALKNIIFLEANYRCIAVVEADRSCHVSVTSNPLHIMRPSTTKLSCGTKSQPWTLEAPAGQRINVSLLDFGQRAREPVNQHHCQQYGYVVDRAANKNVSICGLVDERRKDMYQSTSNIIEIILDQVDDVNNEQQQALIGLEAVGCTNLVPPVDTWLRRNSQEAVVGCYTSHQSWHLRCVNNNWIGVIGNCTREIENWSEPEAETSVYKDHTDENNCRPIAAEYRTDPLACMLCDVVLVTVAIGIVGLIVCAGIVVCGIVCLKRYQVTNEAKFHQQVDKNAGYWKAAQEVQTCRLVPDANA